MSEDLQKPPVIDLEAIFTPISEENPSGENLRYSGLYDEILEARRADEDLALGVWKTDLKTADYRQVIDLAVPALKTQTKDLQISAWLSEALVMEYGFAGLRDSFKLMSGLQEKFWETLFPEIDEGDMESRANAVDWMDDKAALAIQKAPITQGEGYSYLDFEDSKRFDIPENIDTLSSDDQNKYRALQAQAEKENRVTGDLWRKARAVSRRAFYEDISVIIEECKEAYQELNRVIEEKYDRNQMPGMSNLKKIFEEIQAVVKTLLEEKRKEEPDAIEETADEEVEIGADGAVITTTGVATGSGVIRNRQDALKRLSDLADFFHKTEPHSPVAYLIQRAVKWGNMPLEMWLQDVIKDENIMFQLRQTLGFNTNLPDSTEQQ